MSTSKYEKYGPRAFGVSCVHHRVVFASSEEEAQLMAAPELGCEAEAVTVEGRIEQFDHYAKLGYLPGKEYILHGISAIDCDTCGADIHTEDLETAVFDGPLDFCSKMCHARHRTNARMRAS